MRCIRRPSQIWVSPYFMADHHAAEITRSNLLILVSIDPVTTPRLFPTLLAASARRNRALSRNTRSVTKNPSGRNRGISPSPFHIGSQLDPHSDHCSGPTTHEGGRLARPTTRWRSSREAGPSQYATHSHWVWGRSNSHERVFRRSKDVTFTDRWVTPQSARICW